MKAGECLVASRKTSDLAQVLQVHRHHRELHPDTGVFGLAFQPRECSDYFAANIKGIGYKEASHYLRNIGFFGNAILDKHILKTLFEFGIIVSPNPPSTKKKYLATEEIMRNFAEEIRIDFDELDLLLWSNKTGEILK